MKRFRTAPAVLALVLLCALLVPPAAAAAYPDRGQLVHTEAADTLTALGLFAGYEDGTFRPEAQITRAQMCKVITLFYTGGHPPVLDPGAAAPFSDTAGHWADGYIVFCHRLGIVSGDAGAGGRFRPDDSVTAAEAAKMVLISLGYHAVLSRFTGSSWAISVAVAADQKELFTELSGLSLPSALTRDSAAQMLYNALEAAMVAYTYALVSVDGALVSIPRAYDTADTILGRYFGAARHTGVIVANEHATAAGDASTLPDADRTALDTDGDGAADLLFHVATGADQLGRRVTVYAKQFENGVYQTVFGAPVSSPSNRAVTYSAAFASAAALEDALALAGIARLDAAVVTNCVRSGSAASFSALHALMGNGIAVTVVQSDPGLGAADYILVTRKSVGRVVGYTASGAGVLAVQNTSTGALDIGGVPFSRAAGAQSVKLGDLVLYRSVGSLWQVEPAAFAAVTPVGKNASSVIGGGSTYEGSALVSVYNADGAASLSDAVTLGCAYRFYFDNAGFVVFAEKAGPSARYLMLLAVGNASPLYDTLAVNAVLDDGTQALLSVSALTASGTVRRVAAEGAGVEAALKASVVTAADAQSANPKVYSYTVASDGTCALTELPTGYNTTRITANAPTLGTSGLLATDQTGFVLAYDGGFRAYSGPAEIPTVDTSGDLGYCFTYVTNGAVAVAFLKGAVAGVGNHEIYVLNPLPTVTYEREALVYRYSVLLDGARTALEVRGAVKAAAFSRAGLVTNAALTIDGIWQLDTHLVPAAAGDVSFCADGVIRGPVLQGAANGTTWSEETLSCRSATKVYSIDGETVQTGSLGDVVAIAGHPSVSSDLLIVRASRGTDSPDYYVAGSIYLVQSH